jgi:antirestriction protein ArdC
MTNSIYENVTNKIIEKIEKGGLEKWVQSWGGDFNDPKNPVTGTQYKGINYMLLSLSGYSNPNWLTFKQVSEKGGKVKKGEKSTMIIYYKQLSLTSKNEAGETEDTGRVIPMLRGYLVFNATQCENLPEQYLKTPEPKEKKFSSLLEVAKNSGFKIQLGGNRAFYSPDADKIVLPNIEQFNDLENFEATLLHELTHLTGHEDRLNRLKKFNRFGSQSYAFEELIAELGSAFSCAKFGIQGKLQHSEYIASWLQVLRSDKTAIFRAATEAQKACDYLIEKLKAPEQQQLLLVA